MGDIISQDLSFTYLQTDDALPGLEEQGVRQLYPKGPNIGMCI